MTSTWAHFNELRSFLNKAGYKAIQSRMVEQEQLCENHSEFKNVTDGWTNLLTYPPTDQQGKVKSPVSAIKKDTF